MEPTYPPGGTINKPFLRRAGSLLLTLLAVHATAFFLLRAARGGPFDQDRELPTEVLQELRAQYHLDESILQQYFRSLQNLLHGEFGPSFAYRGVSVSDILADALPISLALGFGALLLALLIGLPAGILSAWKKNSKTDAGLRTLSSLLLALPNFVLAGLAISLFSFTLEWLPPAGSGGIRHQILPTLCLGLPFAAQIYRLTRNEALSALQSAPTRTARAKGLPESKVLQRHVFPRTLVPIVAFLGPATAGILTGSLVIEQVFALPGLGSHFVQSALNRDYTLSLGITVLYTALLGTLTFFADVLLARLDPRIQSIR